MNNKYQIFISSQMSPNTLRNERRAARDIIQQFDFFFMPWDWENNGPAGSKTPMEYCLSEVRRSYGLVLIVSRTLTSHTRKEYRVAKDERKHLFVFFKKGCQQGAARLFKGRLKPSWREFRNTSEFESMLSNSLRELIRDALGDYKATPSTSLTYRKAKA